MSLLGAGSLVQDERGTTIGLQGSLLLQDDHWVGHRNRVAAHSTLVVVTSGCCGCYCQGRQSMSSYCQCRQLLLCWGLSFRRHLLLKVLGCRASPPIGPRDTRTSPRRALVEADRSCCGGGFFLETEAEATLSLVIYRSVGCGTVA